MARTRIYFRSSFFLCGRDTPGKEVENERYEGRGERKNEVSQRRREEMG